MKCLFLKMGNSILYVATPPDFNFGECLWYLDRNFDDCMYKAEAGELSKVLEINEQVILVRISAEDGQLLLSIPSGLLNTAEEQLLIAYVENWFDVRLDLSPFYKLLQQNGRLAYMAAEFRGLRMVGIPDLFEAICWAIIGQQINLTFAYKLKRRLVEKYGIKITAAGAVYYLFPKPEVLAAADVADLQAMQFSKSKAAYLTTIARVFATQVVSEEQLLALPDLQSRQQTLMAIKGIGVWTANYALMKLLKERSCIPFGDAGLLNAMIGHQLIADKQQLQQIKDFFSGFAGWESYLVFYFWRSLAVRPLAG